MQAAERSVAAYLPGSQTTQRVDPGVAAVPAKQVEQAVARDTFEYLPDSEHAERETKESGPAVMERQGRQMAAGSRQLAAGLKLTAEAADAGDCKLA